MGTFFNIELTLINQDNIMDYPQGMQPLQEDRKEFFQDEKAKEKKDDKK